MTDSDEKGVVLDSEAQSLFEQLGGTEVWKKTRPDLMTSEGLAQSLMEEQKRFDTLRIWLIETASLVSRYLIDDKFAQHNPDEPDILARLTAVLENLAKAPVHLGAMLIRFRGTPPDPNLPDKFDYETVIGNTAVDLHMAPRLVRRVGSDYAHLPDQLRDAYTIFSDYGINNIYVRLPMGEAVSGPLVQFSLKILSGFRTARQTALPIKVATAKGQRLVPVINDENMFPDPNLTILAGINGLSEKAMANLVEKVDLWLRKSKDTSALKRYAGVYNAAMELPKIKAKLKPPPVEINNVKWLITEAEDEAVSLEKSYIAQLAMETAGASPQKVAKILKSVYGDDYAKINSTMLGERLHLSSDLLSAAEKKPQGSTLKKEVLTNLHVRLDQVKDHVMDEVQLSKSSSQVGQQAEAQATEGVHEQIFQMVQFFKGRSNTHKKMVGMVHRTIDFTAQDYAILAKDYRITIEAAQTLVMHLKGCFTQDGHFSKRDFHDAIPHFQQYEQKIFGFLWHHMKDTVLSEDRIPFLNGLQTLTARMNQPNRAFKVLLEDFCSDPESLQFSDNKAIMLANLILHRPDKALADYEITPEDIVLTRHNLNEVVVEYAAWRIEKIKETFFAKLNTIHKKLVEALSLGQTSEKRIPAPVVLNLERELYIFLSLVECETGKAILRSAVHEYGDPDAQIYNLKESQNNMGGLLQNLRVALRGLGSVGSMNDVGILEHVRMKEEHFQRLKKDRQHRAQARRITEWADEAIKFIKFRV
jgi:hypothetical protein